MTLLAESRPRSSSARRASLGVGLSREAPASAPSAQPVGTKFWFKFLNDSGGTMGLRADRGELSGALLVLDGEEFPAGQVTRAAIHRNRVDLVLRGEGGRSERLSFVVLSGPLGGRAVARGLKRQLDRIASARRAAWRRGMLASEGRGRLFRACLCGHCGAVIDLTGFARTPLVYCSCCESVSTPGFIQGLEDTGEPETREDARYRPCQACGYFGRLRESAGEGHALASVAEPATARRLSMCAPCLRRGAWASFWIALPTVIGAALAWPRRIGLLSGASGRPEVYDGLEHANDLAARGRMGEAEAAYEAILERAPRAPGIHINRALVRARVGDWSGCLDSARSALALCSNYTPALAPTLKALEALGRLDDAESLRARWGSAR